MDLDWKANHAILKHLYLFEDKSLPVVMKEMSTEHNFTATKSQYLAQFKRWNWRKNLTEAEWKYIGRETTRRKELGKETEVIVNDIPISRQKAEKEIRRYVRPTFTFISPPTPPGSEMIQIRTPPAIDDSPGPSNNVSSSCNLMSKKRRNMDTSNLGLHGVKRRNMLPPSQQQVTVNGRSRNLSIQKSPMSKRYPFRVFQDFTPSMDKDLFSTCQLLARRKFFDQALSLSMEANQGSLFYDTRDSDPYLAMDCFWLQPASPRFRGHSRTDGLWESYASYLSPLNASLDTFSNLMRQEDRLKLIIENIPEIKDGEIESLVDSLTGRPDRNSSLRLFEITVYLASNNIHWNETAALQWVVEAISEKGLKTLCESELSTLQQFKCKLLEFASSSGELHFIKRLCKLDGDLRVVFHDSVKIHVRAVASKDWRTLELLLAIWAETSSANKNFWKAIPQYSSFTLTGDRAKLLTSRGVSLFDAPHHVGWRIRPHNLFLSAIEQDDYVLMEHLLTVSSDHLMESFAEKDNRTSLTPVHLAIALSRTKILRLLLNHGANIHTFNYISAIGLVLLPPYVLSGRQPSTSTPLQSAAAIGNMEIVIMLHKAGALTNEPAYGLTGKTALQAAIEEGHSDMVRWLLENGANPNAPGTTSINMPRTPLLAAVERNDHDLVQLLLQFGANPELPVTTSYGASLMEAAKGQKADSRIIMALSTASQVQRPTVDSQPPISMLLRSCLILAIIGNDIRGVQNLLSKGTQIDLNLVQIIHQNIKFSVDTNLGRDLSLATVLQLAVRNNVCHGLFELLVNNMAKSSCLDSNVIDLTLHEAVYLNKVTFAKIMLENGANTNSIVTTRRFMGMGEITTVMHIAARNKSPDMVALLLRNGAVVDARDSDGNTPLLQVMYLDDCLVPSISSEARLNIVRQLLDGGACPNSPPEKGARTALQAAIWCNDEDLDLINLLLDRGADVNMLSFSSGFNGLVTALQVATFLGHLETVKLLLRRGADVNLRSAGSEGWTPLQSALDRGFAYTELIVILLDNGADVNATAPTKEPGGMTALQAAACSGKIKLVELLLSRGADVNAPAGLAQEKSPFRRGGGSALCWAAAYGYLKIAEILLSHGADVNPSGSESVRPTALQLACMKGSLDLVQLLLNHGADLHLPVEQRYQNALRLAKENFHLGISSLLQRYRDEALEMENGPQVEEFDPEE